MDGHGEAGTEGLLHDERKALANARQYKEIRGGVQIGKPSLRYAADDLHVVEAPGSRIDWPVPRQAPPPPRRARSERADDVQTLLFDEPADEQHHRLRVAQSKVLPDRFATLRLGLRKEPAVDAVRDVDI